MRWMAATGVMLVFLIVVASANPAHGQGCVAPEERDCGTLCNLSWTSKCVYVQVNCSYCWNVVPSDPCFDQCAVRINESLKSYNDCVTNERAAAQACQDDCFGKNEKDRKDYLDCLEKAKNATANVSVSGNVTIMHADGSFAPPGTQTLSEGDSVVTGNGGKALINLDDGKKVWLDPNTKFTLKSDENDIHGVAWIQYPDGHLVKTGRESIYKLLGEDAIDLLQGKLSVVRARNIKWVNFYVYTVDWTLAVRGTEFIVDYENNETTIYLNEGALDVTPIKGGVQMENETVAMEAGNIAKVDENGVITVTPLSGEEWASQNESFGNETVNFEDITPENQTNQTPGIPGGLQLPKISGPVCPSAFVFMFAALLVIGSIMVRGH